MKTLWELFVLGKVLEKFKRILKTATPRAFKTIWWIFKITATVSFAIFVLKYTGILTWISTWVSPVFSLFGLPGDAAMAYVSGYFINVYSCVAVISTLDLGVREITILGTMSLAAHAMVVESAVQQKTGTPIWYSFVLRSLGSVILGLGLNWLLPGRPEVVQASSLSLAEVPFFQLQGAFGPLFLDWLIGLIKLGLWMTCLIWALNILQRSLYEFGVMKAISRFFRPLLWLFGLPEKCSFLWIVANIIGLSYGSAAIFDELSRGNLNRRETHLLNTHIGICHSNLEDLLLFAACGGMWWVMLVARWAIVTILVWLLRAYYFLISSNSISKTKVE
ncbi:MAG: hypothetical protein J6V49_07415 [Bacteroidales bacterium]|nr:hypothetical protein [Bacteroidales bacterium]MBO7183945.1 hypothetical protein [Bacteroidales bacterium]